jgi:glutaredoxin 2
MYSSYIFENIYNLELCKELIYYVTKHEFKYTSTDHFYTYRNKKNKIICSLYLIKSYGCIVRSNHNCDIIKILNENKKKINEFLFINNVLNKSLKINDIIIFQYILNNVFNINEIKRNENNSIITYYLHEYNIYIYMLNNICYFIGKNKKINKIRKSILYNMKKTKHV